MANRQVSVMIRAAMDSAFQNTFNTADQRLKDLTSGLRKMKAEAADMRGLKRVREDIEALTKSIQGQETGLSKMQSDLLAAADSMKKFDEAVEKAIQTSRDAREERDKAIQSLASEKAAIEAAHTPTKEQLAILERLKASMKEARSVEAATRREALSAAKAVTEKRNRIEDLRATIQQYVVLLAAARDSEKKAKEASRALSAEYDQQHAAIAKLESPTKEHLAQLAELKAQVDAANRSQLEATRTVERLSRTLDINNERIQEATGSLSLLEAREKSAAAAASEAAARLQGLKSEYESLKRTISSSPTEEEAARLRKLEAEIERTTHALHDATKAEAQATAERKAHIKTAAENGHTVGQLTRKLDQLSGSLDTNRTRLTGLIEKSGTYSQRLVKNGHDVNNLENAENKLTNTLERQQRTIQRSKAGKSYADRASDLRS